MIGSRAWFALMRRNLVYRKRNWIGTLLEFVLPIAFLGILVAIKGAVEGSGDSITAELIPAFIPDNEFTFTPLSFGDYVTALRATRECVVGSIDSATGEEELWISGIDDQGDNWQVPFVKCDSRECEVAGESAQLFCEYAMVAVSPSSAEDEGGLARATAFRDYIYTRYPDLNNSDAETSVMPFDFKFVQIFDDPQELDAYVKSKNYGSKEFPKVGMAITWDGNSATDYLYSLRQNSTNFNAPEEEGRPASQSTPATDRIVNSFATTDFTVCSPQDGAPDQGVLSNSCTGQYLYNGVLSFQRLVGDFILEDTGAKENGYYVAEAGVQFVQFPQEGYDGSGFFEDIGDFLPLLYVLGLLYSASAMIGYVTKEKELRQKELMKMMSVTESDIGWSWFCSFFGFYLLVAIIVAIVSTQLYENSELAYLLIFWILTFLSIVVFTLFLASLTSKSTRGTLIGLLVFFMGVFLIDIVDFIDGSSVKISIISIHPVGAFSYGILEIGRLEDQSLGLNSDTVDKTDSPSGFTFNTCIQSLIFDCILWGIVTWYLNRVIKPDYGQALPLWFPFTRSYWFPASVKPPTVTTEPDDEIAAAGSPFEPVSDTLKKQRAEGKSIEIHRLRKTFGEKTAVDGLSLSMYSGQITALLGHNGAGKTTTINMLTGALGPTEGYATVAGKDIRTQTQSIREDIGICLQHDCLFPQLTVREHLQFFSRVKGLYKEMSREAAEEHIDQVIQDVALSEKRNSMSRNLSGGMKRKLSVAIAFCGGSKIVLLDEPTSGMDPFSRRFTWNVIRQYRQNRCIILTTHFMDEADILGDRIAIMAEGQLRCVGSSLFLKKKYGVGYQLTIEKNDKYVADADAAVEDESNTPQLIGMHGNDDNLKQIVTGAVSEASLLNNVGAELSYQLPMGAASKFTTMFEGLDKEADIGRINSYGVSVTTLDEVFLLVARGTDSEKKDYASSRKIGTAIADDAEKSARSRMDLENEALYLRHVGALFKKRAAIFRRDKKAWLCTTILPSLFVFLGFVILRFNSPERNLNPLLLNLESLNEDVDASLTSVNPIVFNNPGSEYTCQPGRCAYQMPIVAVEETSEIYYFCGYQARLEGAENCTIEESSDIIGRITGAGATPEPANVTSIFESSVSLSDSAKLFAASQYGAIFYTHENASTINDGSSYVTSVIDVCSSNVGNYTSVECADFGGIGYVVQYNYTALHASPLYQTLADEALVRQALNNDTYNIQCTIQPLPITDVEEGIGAAEDAFTAWFLVVLSFPFIAGAFATFVVEERASKAKHLQTVAGVEPTAYWTSTFFWDVLNYQIPCWITVILMYAFTIDVLTTSLRDVGSGVIVLLVLFGPAAAGFTYCVSFAFTSSSLCNVFVIISGFLVGMGGPLTCFILRLIGEDPSNPKPNLITAAKVVTWVLRFIPSFCLGKGLFNAINIETFNYLEGGLSTAWSEPILLYEVIFLAAETVVYLALAVQLDKWSTNPRAMSIWNSFVNIITCGCCCSSGSSGEDGGVITAALPADDDDVLAEEQRVLNGEANDDLIVLSQLRKVYSNGKVAVNNLSLGIKAGECFGLLGINGAGKTTTMQMLTAEFPPSGGDATLAGFSVLNEPEKTRRRIGYCPQFDAHFANLTGREHVELYASIKGVPSEFVKEASAAKLAEVGLSDSDSDRLCVGYSGGMKRRLSLACALIGQPQLVFLDECSTGVDPVARREIWQLISDMVSKENIPDEEKTSVILTTHSMEECEALCPRISIMANGRLSCLGSAQHLKSKFGQGFQVEMKLILVTPMDEDYKENFAKLTRVESTDAVEAPTEEETFNKEEALAALRALSGDDYLSNLVTADNPIGYNVFKNATSVVGVTLDELAAFATSELRMRVLEKYVEETFPQSVLRERQDSKTRYEIGAQSVRISNIFASIEENKERLQLADYGVSQTSLEQVFNMHAAEAEKLKQGRNDR